MPLALAIIPAALAVAGTGLAVAGQQKAQQNLANTRNREAAQARTLQQQAGGVFKKSLAASTPQVAAEQMGKGEQQRMSAWNDLKSATTPIASALPATQTTTDNPTGAATTASAGGANAWNRLNAKAAAKEGSYSDWNTQQAIKNADASQKLETVNNFSQGNANLTGLEQTVAAQSGDQLSGWGSLVSTLGNMASAAGGSFAGGSKTGVTPLSQVDNYPGTSSMLNGAGAAAHIPNWGKLYG